MKVKVSNSLFAISLCGDIDFLLSLIRISISVSCNLCVLLATLMYTYVFISSHVKLAITSNGMFYYVSTRLR